MRLIDDTEVARLSWMIAVFLERWERFKDDETIRTRVVETLFKTLDRFDLLINEREEEEKE